MVKVGQWERVVDKGHYLYKDDDNFITEKMRCLIISQVHLVSILSDQWHVINRHMIIVIIPQGGTKRPGQR